MKLAQILVRSLHPGLEERVKPLREDFQTLIPVHAAHIGLCHSFRRESSLVIEEYAYLEYIHCGSHCGQRMKQQVQRRSSYLAPPAHPLARELDVPVD
jgi:hypothetical protein